MTVHKMSLSTSEPNNNVGLIKVRQDDQNSNILDASIVENGKKRDFTGLNVFLEARMPVTNFVVRMPVADVDYVNSVVKATLIDKFWQQLGPVRAWFSFEGEVDGIPYRDSVANFEYTVIEGNCRNIKQGNYIWEFDQILQRWESIESLLGTDVATKLAMRITDVENDVTSFYTLLNDKIIGLEDNKVSISEFIRLSEWVERLQATKADQTYVDAQLAAIVNGAPTATFKTLDALKKQYPNGATGVFLVLADGHWYAWDEVSKVWKDGGTWQLPIDPASNIPTEQFGLDDIASAPLAVVNVTTRIDSSVIGFTGKLRSVTFRTNGLRQVKIKLFSLQGGAIFKTEAEFILTTKPVLYSYVAGVDFADVHVEKGWYVGIYAENSAIPYTTTIPGISYTIVKDVGVGQSDSYAPNNYRILISVNVETPASSIIDETLRRVEEIDKQKQSEPTNIFLNEKFRGLSLPNKFVNNGFTINNGALSPVVGGYDKKIYWNQEINVEESTARVRITLNDLDVKLAVTRNTTGGALEGKMEVDIPNKKIIIRKTGAGATEPMVEKVTTVNFSVGHDYLIETYYKDAMIQSISITDMMTGEHDELINDRLVTRLRSLNWNALGVTAIAGSFRINSISISTRSPIRPLMAIYGDSLIDGDGMASNLAFPYRYVTLISDKLKGDIVICGKGGETSTGLLAKFDVNFNSIKPKYTLVAIGTNDSSFPTWLSNVQQVIQKIIDNDSIPVLVTLHKITSADRTIFMNQVNDWILGSGYRFLDANIVTSVNFDRQTQDVSMFFNDGVHFNRKGNEAVYQRSLVDLAEIYDLGSLDNT